MSHNYEENEDSNLLKRLGFKFRSSVDEFSYQPDSGGMIGGKRGEQEQGISGNLAAEDNKEHFSHLIHHPNEADADELGVSQFTKRLSESPEDLMSEMETPQKKLTWRLSSVRQMNEIPS